MVGGVTLKRSWSTGLNKTQGYEMGNYLAEQSHAKYQTSKVKICRFVRRRGEKIFLLVAMTTNFFMKD